MQATKHYFHSLHVCERARTCVSLVWSVILDCTNEVKLAWQEQEIAQTYVSWQRALACLLAHKTILGFELSKSIFNKICNHPMHWTRQSH